MFGLDRTWSDGANGVEAGDGPRDGKPPVGDGPRMDGSLGDGQGRTERPVGDAWVERDSGPVCGDGKVTGNEECDPKATLTSTCTGLGYTGGTLTCNSATCKLEGCYKLLDSPAKALATATGNQVLPAVGADGAGFWVAWEDDAVVANSGDIYGALVNATTGAASATQTIAAGTKLQFSPAVVFDGTKYLVVWSGLTNTPYTGGDPYGAWVSTAGTVTAIGQLVGCGDSCAGPGLAFNGTDHLIAAREDDMGTVPGWVVTKTGAPKGTQLTVGASGWATEQKSRPGVASDGLGWLVVWEDYQVTTYGDIFAARVSAQGVVLGTTAISVYVGAGTQSWPVVAHDGSGYLVVWEDKRSGTRYDLYGQRLDASGALQGAAFSVSVGSTSQRSPAIVAREGSGFFVVWQAEVTSSQQEIKGARLTSSGQVLDATPFTISDGATVTGKGYPAVARDGATALVAWEQGPATNRDIYFARVKP